MATGRARPERVNLDRGRKRCIRGYTIIKQIGRGAFGKVYLVEKNQQKWAMKVVSLDKLRGKDTEHCLGECEVMRKCKHPNLVTFCESFQEDKNLYIIMEYCERGSLKDVIQRKEEGLKEDETLNFLTQICKALQFLHNEGMIHRDVKTANIFITEDWTLKLGDMALTRHMGKNFAMTVLPGTPIYMSPEVIEQKEYNHKADVWSLGCCFYEMCNGNCLFSIATSFDNLQAMIKMCKNTNTLRIPLCDEMNSLFKDMMSYTPESRPAVDAILRRLEIHTHDPPSRSSSSSPDILTSSRSQSSSHSSVHFDLNYSHKETGAKADLLPARFVNSYSRHLRDSPTDLNETSDYGTDTEVKQNTEPNLSVVSVKVHMTEDQYDWYQKKIQLLKDIRKKVGDENKMTKIRQVLDKASQLMDEEACQHIDEEAFLAQVKHILGPEMFKKCFPDLKALWIYASYLMLESYKLAS